MSQSKPLVVFVPNWSKNNPYQNLLANSVADEYQVNLDNFPPGLKPFTALHQQNPDMQVLHLHWIAELIHRLSWSKSSLFFYIKLGWLLLDLWRVKKRGVKVIWTIHNKLSHQSLDQKRELIIRRQFCRVVDQIILHSPQALELITELYDYPIAAKTAVIFHGNYLNCYPKPSANKATLREQFGINQDDIHLLYFGSIRPYKGVDNLIDCFNQVDTGAAKISLTLAGGVSDPDYKTQLIEQTQTNHHISAIFDFLPEQLLVDHIEAADIIVIPFADTLTSGSTILAMTQGKALILPEKAQVFGCVPEQGVRYFSNTKELTQLLKQLHEFPLPDMAQANLLAATNLTWTQVGHLMKQCYQ
jgi:glycosyltransferase involved in cell wall biosynthesis